MLGAWTYLYRAVDQHGQVIDVLRDQLIQAAGVIASTTIDLAGNIGRQVLANLMTARRLRINARTVKRAISKYNARGLGIDRRTYQATLTISILTGQALTASPDP